MEKKLIEKLIAIQSCIKAPKTQFNSFGKYKYRNCEDILEAVKPLLSKNGLALILTDEIVEEICKLMEFGYRNIDISKSLGVKSNLISLIRHKTAWEHISCKYNIPKRSRSFSEETIRWIWEKIQEGLTQSEIIAASDNKNINNDLIRDLRRGLYPDITGLVSRKEKIKLKNK